MSFDQVMQRDSSRENDLRDALVILASLLMSYILHFPCIDQDLCSSNGCISAVN